MKSRQTYQTYLSKIQIRRFKMKGKWTIRISILAVLLLVLAVGFAWAQEPQPSDEGLQPQGNVSVQATVDAVIPIQGRLTDASGNPVPDGNYSITARIYNVSGGGTALCSDTDPVHVSNGLFNMDIDTCTSAILNGQQLYLGIQVGSDAEMTNRQPIYPVPYAFSLKPGAVISDTMDGILTVQSTGTGDADALFANAGGDGEGLTATSPNGVGVAAFSDAYLAVQGYSKNSSTNPAIFGCVAASYGTCDPYRDNNAAGVMGYSERDFAGYFVSGSSGDGGIYAEANYQLGVGVWAENKGNGMAIFARGNAPAPSGHAYPTLYLVQQNSSGDFVVGADNLLGNRYWRVDRNGKGFFNGGTQYSGADFAEQMPVAGNEAEYEPGDVLVISASADRTVELSTQPFTATVIGVYSTKPAVLAGAPDTDGPLAGIPVAITGIVPCKVSAENGPIHRGDLLVTSSTPGHAMHAGPNPPQGTVLGKALGELKEGTGVIYVLVMLQ
jgi:hypothetical protein